MEIIGKIKVEGFLRVRDLDDGDVFTFLDDNEPYMYGGNNYDDFIINLSTGTVQSDSNAEFLVRPIRRLKAKLIIED